MMTRLPLIFFAFITVFFAIILLNGKDPTFVESAMLNKPVPEFKLPRAVRSRRGLSSKELRKTVSVVNFFASWCLVCRLEQGILEEITQSEKIPVYGVAYKDDSKKLKKWLKKFGDPYKAIAKDKDGRVSIDWGVSGIPETFIVDAQGIIRYRHSGVVTDDDYQRIFKPILLELKK